MIRIKEIDINDRPRERALKEGFSSLSDSELLAIIVRTGTKDKSALDLANDLLMEFNGLNHLMYADTYELMKIKGIKRAKALEIGASLELVKRATLSNSKKIEAIKESSDVFNLLKDDLSHAKQEKFIVLFLNVRNRIIKQETIFVGGESESLVDVNLIYKKAISYGAKKIICVHNHPSNDTTPSNEDILLTKRIKNMGEFLKIHLLDHIVIGDDDYTSIMGMKLI